MTIQLRTFLKTILSNKRVIRLTLFTLTLVLLLTFIGGCGKQAVGVEKKETNSSQTKDNESLITGNVTQEFELHPEDVLSPYVFNGFIDNNRLSFGRIMTIGGYAKTFQPIYHPAIVGYTFNFKELKGRTFTILKVNPERNYIKVKVTTTTAK